MSKITKYLNQLITGNVFDTPEIRNAYSTDRSILQIVPKLVAFPESTEDLKKLLRFFNQLASKKIRVPIAVRGSGLDETGADLSNGLVISTEKFNHLLEIDIRERLVRVQSGITLKELNTALSVRGLTIPVNANEQETIGSLISNCPTDSYAGKYGGIMNFVERAEIILSNGESIQTGRINFRSIAKKANSKTLESKIYKSLYEIIQSEPAILGQIKNQPTSAGYQSIAYAAKKGSIDLLPLFFAAQGTLGIISEVILHATIIPPKPTGILIASPNFKSALPILNFINNLKPCETNFYDLRILKTAEKYGKNLGKITRKSDSGYIIYASFDEKDAKSQRKIRKCANFVKNPSKVIIENETNHQLFNEFKNTVTSYLNLSPDKERPPLITDFYIPSDKLANFLSELTILESKLKAPLPLYGSYSTSNYHIRPEFDLKDQEEHKKAILFLKTGDLLIHRQNGSLASGSPDGRIKSLVTNTELSPEEKALYKQIKTIFDPNNILNPNTKIFTDAKFTIKHIRKSKLTKTNL